MAKKRTFAQEAKKITNKYKLRLGDKFDKGDPLALAAMNAELEELREKQEQVRESQLSDIYACGGKLKMKAMGGRLDPDVRGYRNLRLSGFDPLGVTGFAGQGAGTLRDSLNRSAINGSIRFDPIRGIGSFATGGNLPTYPWGGGLPYSAISSILDVVGNKSESPSNVLQYNFDQFTTNPNQYIWNQNAIDNIANTYENNPLPITQETNAADPVRASETIEPTGGPAFDPYKSRVPWIGALSTGLSSILANRKLDLPSYDYDVFKPTQLAPHLVDYSRGREQTMRERDLSNAVIRRNAAGIGSQAGLMENIIAGVTGTQRAAGTAFNQSLEGEQNVNAQIKNEVAARNAQAKADAFRVNSQNKLYANQLDREAMLINDQRRQNMIYGISDAITGYSRDLLDARRYDDMLNMEQARNPNYNIRQQDPSFWRRLAGITDPIEEIYNVNTNDRVSG